MFAKNAEKATKRQISDGLRGFFCVSRHIWAIIASTSNYYLNYSQLVTLPWQHTCIKALGIFVISSTETKLERASTLQTLSWASHGVYVGQRSMLRSVVQGVFSFLFNTVNASQILHTCFNSHTLLQMGQQLPCACKLFYCEAWTQAAATNPMYVCVFRIESALTVWRFEKWMCVGRENSCWSVVRLGESDSYFVNHGCVCNLVVGMSVFFFQYSQERRLNPRFDSMWVWHIKSDAFNVNILN